MGPTVQINQVENGFVIQVQGEAPPSTYIASSIAEVLASIEAAFTGQVASAAVTSAAEKPAEKPVKEKKETAAAKKKRLAAEKKAQDEAEAKAAEKVVEEDDADIMGDVVGDNTEASAVEVTEESLTALIRKKAAEVTPKVVLTKFKSFGFANTAEVFEKAPEQAADIYAAIEAL